MKLYELRTEQLLNVLPENRPLYKDSGLWQIRTDDMEEVYMIQGVNESFKSFIIRYIEWIQDVQYSWDLEMDLSIEFSRI